MIQEGTKEILDNYAKEGEANWNDRLRKGDAFETLEDVNKKIVETLKLKSPKEEESVTSGLKDPESVVQKGKEEDELEDWLNDYLS